MAVKMVLPIISYIINPRSRHVKPDPPADAVNVLNDGQPDVDDNQRSVHNQSSEPDKVAPDFEYTTPDTVWSPVTASFGNPPHS